MAVGLDPEALLAEAAWLKRLAVTLAGNSDDADDLVQESALLPMVVDCYKQARLSRPALAGTLVVNFTIEGEPGIGGVVTQSAIDPEKSEIKDSDLGKCVEETTFALRQPTEAP